MKKRISLLAVLLALVFVLSGCSESSEADYDKETLISQADALISSFSQMSSEELDAFKDVNELQLNLTLLQSGFNVDAANFTTMIDAWEAGVEECGDYVEHDDFKVEESSGSIMLTSDAKYKDRDAEITIEFSEDSKNVELYSLSQVYDGRDSEKGGIEYRTWNGNGICRTDFHFLYYFPVWSDRKDTAEKNGTKTGGSLEPSGAGRNRSFRRDGRRSDRRSGTGSGDYRGNRGQVKALLQTDL